MRVILTHDVPSLGTIGSVVNVKNGYGRNYLLPQALAILANESNTKQLEHHKRLLAKKKETILKEARALASKIEQVSFEIAKQVGEEERIFGSVTPIELAALLEGKGFNIAKKDIEIADEVKKVGSYVANIRLNTEVIAKLKFSVVAAQA